MGSFETASDRLRGLFHLATASLCLAAWISPSLVGTERSLDLVFVAAVEAAIALATVVLLMLLEKETQSTVRGILGGPLALAYLVGVGWLVVSTERSFLLAVVSVQTVIGWSAIVEAGRSPNPWARVPLSRVIAMTVGLLVYRVLMDVSLPAGGAAGLTVSRELPWFLSADLLLLDPVQNALGWGVAYFSVLGLLEITLPGVEEPGAVEPDGGLGELETVEKKG